MGDSNFTVEDRVQCEDNRGTVRYVGALSSTTGIWLGIDWDNPSRGKHSGIHQGQQYFQTKHLTSGSFVRSAKAEKGVSICQALKNKYGDVQESSVIMDKVLKEEVRRVMKATLLEIVGFERIAEKQSNLHEMSEAILSDWRINSPGLPGELTETSPNIRILVLSCNLLKNWEDVARICEQLPSLQSLDLRDNRLKTPEAPESLSPAFATLKTLILSSCDLDWPALLHYAKMWPQIENLFVTHNKITFLTPFTDVLQNLRVLDLSDNRIEDWSELNPLGELPLLEELYCAHVGLKNVDIPANQTLFPCLRVLRLPHNQLSRWRSISELNKLPVLENLRITNNDALPASNCETRSQLVVARLVKLKILDGRIWSAAERRGAEIDYLKKYGKEYLQLRSASNHAERIVFLEEHPRYMELIQKYGPPEAGELQAKPTSLASNLLNLTLRCGSESTIKRLPRSMTVQKLKALFMRTFRVDDTNLRLVALNAENPALRIEMDNDLKELDFFSLSPGDVIEAQ